MADLCLSSQYISVLLKALIPVWALKFCLNCKIFCNFCVNKPIIIPVTAAASVFIADARPLRHKYSVKPL